MTGKEITISDDIYQAPMLRMGKGICIMRELAKGNTVRTFSGKQINYEGCLLTYLWGRKKMKEAEGSLFQKEIEIMDRMMCNLTDKLNLNALPI